MSWLWSLSCLLSTGCAGKKAEIIDRAVLVDQAFAEEDWKRHDRLVGREPEDLELAWRWARGLWARAFDEPGDVGLVAAREAAIWCVSRVPGYAMADHTRWTRGKHDPPGICIEIALRSWTHLASHAPVQAWAADQSKLEALSKLLFEDEAQPALQGLVVALGGAELPACGTLGERDALWCARDHACVQAPVGEPVSGGEGPLEADGMRITDAEREQASKEQAACEERYPQTTKPPPEQGSSAASAED